MTRMIPLLLLLASAGCTATAEPPPPPTERAPATDAASSTPQPDKPPPAEPAPPPPPTLSPPADAHDPTASDALWLYDHGGDVQTDLLTGQPDPELQALMMDVIQTTPAFKAALDREGLGMVLVDISDPRQVVHAEINADWETFTASLSKIAVLLGVVNTAHQQKNPDLLVQHKEAMDQMIKWSSNQHAIELFGVFGHEAISGAVREHGLYDDERGGLWWTRSSAKSPSVKTGTNVAGTARMVARYFLMMEQGKLVTPDDSRFIKSVLNNAALAIFSQGIQKAYPDVTYYGKPGIYGEAVAEGLLIEGPNTRYVMAILTTGLDYQDPVIGEFGEKLHAKMRERHPEPFTP